MKTLLRNNLPLAIGCALPLLVAVFFVLANRLPAAFVDPPAHDLVLIDETAPATRTLPVQIGVEVADGRLQVRAFRTRPGRYSVPRLFLWQPGTEALREVALELPDNLAGLPDGAEIVVPELSGRRLDTSAEAPDGYAFEHRRSGSGLFGIIYSGGGTRTVIAKRGATYVIPEPADAGPYYSRVRFLAWVVE